MESFPRFIVLLAFVYILSQVFPKIDFLLHICGHLTLIAYISWKIADNVWRWLPSKKVSPHKKAVLVTGCNKGFGYQLARRLHGEGYIVFAACRSLDGEGARSLKLNYSPDRMHVIQMDIAKQSDIDEAKQEVQSKLKNGEVLWAVVNNAGIADYGLIAMEPMETFERIVRVNQLGTVRVTKAFLPFIHEARGRIIIVSSILGRIAPGCIAPYAMSKHALVAFCDCLRRELVRLGVKVIGIEPALYRTMLVPDERNIRNTLEQKWKTSDECIRNAYGDAFLRNMIEENIHASKLADTNVAKVVETIVFAVVQEYLEVDVIRVASLIRDLELWIYHLMPLKIQDILMSISRRTGMPTNIELVKKELGIYQFNNRQKENK